MRQKEVSAAEMNDFTEGNPSAATNLGTMDLQWFAEGGDGDTGGDPGSNAGGDAGGDAPQGTSGAGEPTGDNLEGAGDAGQQGDGGAEPKLPGWQAGLKSELRGKDELSGFETLTDLAAKYLDLSKKADGAIKIPGDDAPEEDVKAYREAMGIPENSNDYQLEVGGIDDPEYIESMKRQAHDLGLSQKQAQALYEQQNKAFTSYLEQAKQEQKAAVDKVTTEMKKELGDQYKPKMQAAQRVTKSVMGQEFAQYLDQSGLGNDARMIKAMIRLSDVISEDALPTTQEAGARKQKDWDFAVPDDL